MNKGPRFWPAAIRSTSGKIAACIATTRPGATNLITGIANAYVDKQPVLIITGETATTIFWRGGQLES